MRILEKLSIVLSLLILTACNQAMPSIRYIDKPYEVKVPVKCIVPDANCSFNKETATEVVASLVECIVDMKKNEEVCK